MNYYRKEGERQDTAEWWEGGRPEPTCTRGPGLCQEGSLLRHWFWGVEKALGWAGAGHGPRDMQVCSQGPSRAGPEGQERDADREEREGGGRKGKAEELREGSGEAPSCASQGFAALLKQSAVFLRLFLGNLQSFWWFCLYTVILSANELSIEKP